MPYKQRITLQGFTLVELSIVIIIIGFLIAGIAVGQSLIKQVTLNSVITDMQGFQSAYNGFVLRYGGVPGDITDASAYWGDGVCAQTSTRCNGSGDGKITRTVFGDDEAAAAWKELSLAGLISANIATIPNSFSEYEIGVSAPASRITDAGYLMSGPEGRYEGDIGQGLYTIFSPWLDDSTNAVFLGQLSGYGLGNPALSAEDAFALDQKIDDGVINSSGQPTGALTGNIRAVNSAAGGYCATPGSVFNGQTNIYNFQNFVTCVVGMALN